MAQHAIPLPFDIGNAKANVQTHQSQRIIFLFIYCNLDHLCIFISTNKRYFNACAEVDQLSKQHSEKAL